MTKDDDDGDYDDDMGESSSLVNCRAIYTPFACFPFPTCFEIEGQSRLNEAPSIPFCCRPMHSPLNESK